MNNSIKIHDVNCNNKNFCSKNCDYCKEFCETDKLYIDKCKPSIKDIREVFVNICIDSYKIIKTCSGDKLIITGCKHVKILYTSKCNCNKIYCDEFAIPFCNFILLHCCNPKICNILSGIEYCCVKKCNSRSFYISLLIFVCPEFKTHCCFDDNDCCENSYQCDCCEDICECDCCEDICQCDCCEDSCQCDCCKDICHNKCKKCDCCEDIHININNCVNRNYPHFCD